MFGNLILADEINRAPAKVQAALLEAMEERQITVAGNSHALPELFIVVATQNPIEQEGTYPLPEAQMDRFLMKVLLDYPNAENESQVLRLLRVEEQALGARTAAVQGFALSQEVIFAARRENWQWSNAVFISHWGIFSAVGSRTSPPCCAAARCR